MRTQITEIATNQSSHLTGLRYQGSFRRDREEDFDGKCRSGRLLSEERHLYLYRLAAVQPRRAGYLHVLGGGQFDEHQLAAFRHIVDVKLHRDAAARYGPIRPETVAEKVKRAAIDVDARHLERKRQ